MYCRKKMVEKTWKKEGQRVTQTCNSSLWKHVRGTAESVAPPDEVWGIWESFQKNQDFFHVVKCFVTNVIGILIEIVEKSRFSDYQKFVNLGFPYSLGFYSIRKTSKIFKESDIVFSKSISDMPKFNRYDMYFRIQPLLFSHFHFIAHFLCPRAKLCVIFDHFLLTQWYFWQREYYSVNIRWTF